MGVMNRVMNFLGLQEEEEVVQRERVVEEPEETETNPFEQRKHKGNVVSIHSQKNTRVTLSEPRAYEDAQELADQLRSRRSVVVNLHRVSPEIGMRIVDFLGGTVYALNGQMAKIGPNIFLCTPDTVEIHGVISELLDDEAETNKMR
ncbi:cell division protein SepF [Paenibacillus contaminans]|uniref:Cell division protein SepF n=1 Tax=Paenibacillus contaminans TaxID=450362 RepID=A0A329MJR0_9BACL|nr:cell division protein SepF [Paenibacillus contaminans]RAV19818.1 cell division protein SepF [Paenibacillus contaminans]